MAETKEDLEEYREESRYGFALLIAGKWFEFLDGMKPERLEELKEDLTNMTLVGEYVGDPEHQHLIKYERTTVVFYAIVANYSEETCIPTDKAYSIMQKYGLDTVKVTSVGIFQNYELLLDSLYQLFKEVSQSSLADDEEGSVLYFIKRSSSLSEKD